MADEAPKRTPRNIVGTEAVEFDAGSLICSWFITGGQESRGLVLAEPQPGVYLVEFLNIHTNQPLEQHLVKLPQMFEDEWVFFDTREQMLGRLKLYAEVNQ
jgi:hypothetical protein